ncbi:MAG: tripartite tricarboxylate transporter substrate binding protein [Armatimonadota bacterium]|nr:tripartite tricarboxylate transporter substrate binding protein [Armatimonadota bacterium]MDR7475854.1 tripartite tricarboxylate transporter substrate binding protein [Armatimonadota bacterium]
MARALAGILVAVLLLGGLAAAQQYPSKPITLIVPWSPGGSTDLTARALAPVLERELKVPVQVVNRTGGGGAIGHGAIARARPDGYTIGIITLEVVLPAWVAQTKIDSGQFTPISLLVLNPVSVVVRRDAKWRTIQEFVADLRANPGRYKSSGTARFGSYDYARLGFLRTLGLGDSALPWVPAQGAASALQELVAGGVDVAFVAIGEASGLVRSGEARYLAFMTERRFPGFVEVPTLKELGVDWTFASFLMAAGPRRLPPDVVERLDAAFAKAVGDGEFIRFMNNANLVVAYLGRTKARDFLEERARTMRRVHEEVVK